jgi:hypothetical protein
MKIDVLVGNPPYNKSLVKRNNMNSWEQGLNQMNEGYIAFIIKSLDKIIVQDGNVIMLTPGKYLTGISAKDFRQWIAENYDLYYVKMEDGKKIFPGVGIGSLTTAYYRTCSYNGTTIVESPDGKKTSMDFRKNQDYIIPSFSDQKLYDSYCNVADFIPIDSVKSVGEYGTIGKSNFSKDKTDIYCNEVVYGIKNNQPLICYTDLVSDHTSINCWRVINNISYPQENWTLLQPGPELSFSKWGISFKSKEDAKNFLEWTKTPNWKKLWCGLYTTWHTEQVSRYMPLYEI